MLRPILPIGLVGAAAIALAACGGSDDKGSKSSGGSSGSSSSAKQIEVKLTDAGCDPAELKLDSGRTTFKVTNAGTSKVNEFEIFDGQRILGEKENLVAGLSGSFTLVLNPGNYTTACPGGTTNGLGTLKVGGVAAAASQDPLLQAAVTGYKRYVTAQSKELLKRVEPFVAAVKAGDTEKAKSLFASARVPYETIEPVAESFGDLDPKIDARVNDVKKGDEWTGFHRIEQTLWQKNSTTGLAKYADQLLADCKTLEAKTRNLTYQPDELANGANGLLGEVASSKITGEEDRYSHTDLSDFEANVSGAQTAFGLLAPALKAKNAALATQIEGAFTAVQQELAALKQGSDFPSYDTVKDPEREKLAKLVDALAKPLAKTSDALGA